MRGDSPTLYGKTWFRDLDSNQDTQLQRLMSYRLDDPGMLEEIVAEGCKRAQTGQRGCLSPIILSPLNGQVKMSPHEQGDILIESERVATSGGDFSMYQRGGGVCQSPRAALLEPPPQQALRETSSPRRGSGPAAPPSRPAYAPPASRG